MYKPDGLIAWLASWPLPLGGIATRVKYGKHDNDIHFDCEVHGVRQTPEKRPADPGADELVLERSVSDTVVGCAKFIQKLQPKA
ncbi:MAG: hypothetical protein ABI629_12485 [bacterium]